MKSKKQRLIISVICGLMAIAILIALSMSKSGKNSENLVKPVEIPPVLTVSVSKLQTATFPNRVFASGNIMAMQEAIISSEANGLRLAEIKVNVGDRVRRGQILATFLADTIDAEISQSRAAVAEASVVLEEASANAGRFRQLKESGTLSMQQIEQSIYAERIARAKLDAAKSAEKMQLLRHSQTRVLAPDDGVISLRSASVGAVLQSGQELFRLIRGGKLEWRAEVAGVDLRALKPGQKVSLTPAGGEAIEGRLRMLSPVIDIQTRNGLVYVDLPPSEAIRVGMFAHGAFEVGTNEVMTLPQSALLLRDGINYVMRVGSDSRVIQTKVILGARHGDRVEIINGLSKEDSVVVSGTAFLGDKDLVRMSDISKVSNSEKPTKTVLPLVSVLKEGAR